MSWRALGAGLVTLGFVLACAGRVEGDLTVDGEKFSAMTCHSGAPQGFTGVDLVSTDEAKVRVAVQPDGQAQVWYFEPGSTVGTDLGVCGTASVTEQNSEINGVKNVMGTADLSCSGAKTVAGFAAFENCH